MNEIRPKHDHAEAFMLMTYTCVHCFSDKVVWNSRDGVTPFMLYCDCGYTMRHDFSRDSYRPDYQPGPDEPVFVDEHRKKYSGGKVGAPRLLAWKLTKKGRG